MANRKVYVESSCFIEMACHKVGTHKRTRELDLACLDKILQQSFAGDLLVYTSVLSVAECQFATNTAGDMPIITDDVKQVFKDILMSGQFLILVQDSVLVAEKARNLRWVHGLAIRGADALHVASALELDCDEFLTFDEGVLKKAAELKALGLSVIFPHRTTVLPKGVEKEAQKQATDATQVKLMFLGEGESDNKQENGEGVISLPPQLLGSGDGSVEDQARTENPEAKPDGKGADGEAQGGKEATEGNGIAAAPIGEPEPAQPTAFAKPPANVDGGQGSK